MLILVHVLIACSSIVASSWLLLAPSRPKLYASYGLTALTLASGTYLVVDRHAPMLSTCEAGLCYLAVVGVAIAAGRYRLLSFERAQPQSVFGVDTDHHQE